MEEITQFKEKAKVVWSDFASMENFTAVAAPRLVEFARVSSRQKVLDVAAGTGVVALTAARTGADVTGSDLTPQLVARANENNEILGFNVDFHEADVEALPFENETFDIVLSQFGHMFAPRPDIAVKEMLRVLKPGGTIAFTTWPPELFMGSFFTINSKYGLPRPAGIPSPVLWGNIDIIKERLGSTVKNIFFDRDKLVMPGLSVQHVRSVFETSAGPLKKMVQAFEDERDKLISLRAELDAAINTYFENNLLRMDYLMTRANKV